MIGAAFAALWPVLLFGFALVGILCICDRHDDRRDADTRDEDRTAWGQQR